MSLVHAGLLVLAWLLSTVLTYILLRYAIRQGVLDNPNERSSHSVPTPRGGGLGIVLATLVVAVVLHRTGSVSTRLLLALGGGGLLVAATGTWDDLRTIPARWRFPLHLMASAGAVALLGGLPPLRFGSAVVDLGWIGHILAVLAITWLLNLYNFMDGIDGIAGGEALTVAGIGGGLFALAGQWPPAILLWAMGAAAVGFLHWNWPPARIFMGDGGSGFLGYAFGVLALAGAREPCHIWPLAILLIAFVADATVNLIRRVISGQKWYTAHCNHAYQHAARRWAIARSR